MKHLIERKVVYKVMTTYLSEELAKDLLKEMDDLDTLQYHNTKLWAEIDSVKLPEEQLSALTVEV